MTKLTEKTNPRVVLYARAASRTPRTDEPDALDAQLNTMRAYAASRGWTNSGEFVEMISGLRRDRPQLEALLGLAQERAFDLLLVHELSRLSRSVSQAFEIFGILESHQMDFASVQEPDFDFAAWRRTASLLI